MELKYSQDFCHKYTENRRLMVSQWNFLFPLWSNYISLCEDITANFLVWLYRIVLFLSVLDPVFTFHCRHFSHSSMLPFTFWNLLFCTLPICKKQFYFIEGSYWCCSVLWVDALCPDGHGNTKKNLAKSLVNRECYWPLECPTIQQKSWT